jgi:hypothetical protein
MKAKDFAARLAATLNTLRLSDRGLGLSSALQTSELADIIVSDDVRTIGPSARLTVAVVGASDERERFEITISKVQ